MQLSISIAIEPAPGEQNYQNHGRIEFRQHKELRALDFEQIALVMNSFHKLFTDIERTLGKAK